MCAVLREHPARCWKGGRAALERGKVGEFSLATKDLKAILKAMETGEFKESIGEQRAKNSGK